MGETHDARAEAERIEAGMERPVIADEVALDEFLEEQPERGGPVGFAEDPLLDLAHPRREAPDVREEAVCGAGGVGERFRAVGRIGQGRFQPTEDIQHRTAVGARLTPFQARELFEEEPRLRVELDHGYVAFTALNQPAGIEEAAIGDRAALDRVRWNRFVAMDVRLAPSGGEITDLGQKLGLPDGLGAQHLSVQMQKQSRVERAARRGQGPEEIIGQLREQHRNAGPTLAQPSDSHPVAYFAPRSSTSKISVAFGGMTPPAPRAP